MRLQATSLLMQNNNYPSVANLRGSKNIQGDSTDKNANKQNGNNVSLSQNANYDKMMEKIQEQIQRVQESDWYDDDTKKEKVEELQKQLEEIEKAKTTQTKDLIQNDKTKKSENSNSNNSSNYNDTGVVLELSIDSSAILQADNSLKSLKSAYSTKVKLEGESNVLASEIKMDKGRGLNTDNKEKELDRLEKGIEKTSENIGGIIKDINEDVNEVSTSQETNNTQDFENLSLEIKEYGADSFLKLDESFFTETPHG